MCNFFLLPVICIKVIFYVDIVFILRYLMDIIKYPENVSSRYDDQNN